MKTRVLRTDVRASDLSVRRIIAAVQRPQGIAFETKILLISTPPKLVEMVSEIEDDTKESDVRDAIAAAALADDWFLAESLAVQYGLVVCLRCAADVAERPTWRLHRLAGDAAKREDENGNVRTCWGEICGSCALEMMELER